MKLVAAIIATFLSLAAAEAAPVKIGVVKTGTGGPVFVAQDKGYFAAEGVPAELVFFESAAPIAVAAASGAIDFGFTATSAALYSLVGQGAVKIVAGSVQEEPGFHAAAYLVSRHAYEGGLKSLKDFAGHSFGVSQVGSPPHYALGLLAEKYGFDIHSVRVLPLQSIPNIASAIAGGQVDTTILTQSPALLPMVERGDVKRLGWVGDETPWQFHLTFAPAKLADESPDTVKRALAALRHGAKVYHDAVTGPDGKEHEGKDAPEILAIVGKYLNQTPAEVRLGISYIDPDLRVNVRDVQHQVAWFKSQGMLKEEVDAASIIDKRYAVPFAGN